jgi:catechol 2,3-dioxygenase-like lactoylglutathione lyase family enzyme
VLTTIEAVISDIYLDHVAVAAEKMADAWPRYAGDLAGRWVGGGDTEGFTSAQVEYANGMRVEVLEPFNVERNDFLRRFLDRNGPGAHHLTFKVKDIRSALKTVEEAGFHPVGVNLSSPWWMEAFLHPKEAPGIVVQLAQSDHAEDDEEEWWSPIPDGFPEPRTPEPATLVRVVQAVADLDSALALFGGLLSGIEQDRGEDEAARWVDLGWKAPDRPSPSIVRLLTPTSSASPVSDWLGDRAGRLHHIAFRSTDPVAADIAPDDNLGVRLVIDRERSLHG